MPNNTHGTPDESRERQAWFGDVARPYVHSGGLPSVPSSSLTFGTFATTGYVRGASADLVYVSQSAAAVGPLNAGNGTYWLALHRDTSTSVSSWTRQTGTHYLWRQTANQPADPSGGLLFSKVTVAGGAITAVTDYRLPASYARTGLYDVTDPLYGALGDGSTNDTSAVQAALTGAAARGRGVWIPAGTYSVTTVIVYNGTRSVGGTGTLQDAGASGQGLLCLDGPNTLSGTAVDTCVLEGLTLTLTNGQTKGIYIDKGTNVTVRGCTLSGGTDSADKYGIYLGPGSSACKIVHNTVTWPTGTPTNEQYGIIAVSDSTAYGGYYTGSGGYAATSAASNPIQHCVIAGNYVEGGSHGISCNGLMHSTITGNVIKTTRDRSIILEPVCRYVNVTGNHCHNFKSSAVICSYGNSNISIVGNTCFSTIANGEAAIQAYLGNQYIDIKDNHIYVDSAGQATNYGVYLGPDSNYCAIIGNTITGFKRAGICLDSGWEVTASLPAGASYARNNTVAPPTGTAWTFTTSAFNTIRGNTIYNPTSAATTAAIVLNQVQDTGGTDYSLTNTVIDGNTVMGTSNTKYLELYEETSGQLTTVKCLNNTWVSAATAKFGFTRGRQHFNFIEHNEFLNQAYSRYSFTDADTTPDVSLGERFVTANTGATTITDFDNGIDGQIISVRGDTNTTIQHNTSLIRLQQGVNITFTSSDQIIEFESLSGIWFERSKNWDPFLLVRNGTFSASNGANADIAITGSGLIYVTGPSGAFSINSIANPVAGRVLYLHNATAQDLTITNDSGGTAANRILTGTGADVTLTGVCTVTLVYSSAATRWLLTATQG